MLKVLGLLVGLFCHEVAERIIKGISGPKKGDLYSAAQFAK
jgi:hypothetical protein